ncbi:MAG: MerR family transcriptional regulator [Anaerolineales bacterium]|nr:MerR family transcriptional regulator [Anaerolineales bacterium]
MTQPPPARNSAAEQSFSFTEVAYHLQVTPDTLRSWGRRFGRFLSPQTALDDPRYSTSDVAALIMVQKLIEQGFSDEQVSERLTPKRIVRDETPSIAITTDQGRQMVEAKATLLPQALGDILSAIANSQQSVLNSQATVRDVVGVVVQDNFNLKEENRNCANACSNWSACWPNTSAGKKPGKNGWKAASAPSKAPSPPSNNRWPRWSNSSAKRNAAGGRVLHQSDFFPFPALDCLSNQ